MGCSRSKVARRLYGHSECGAAVCLRRLSRQLIDGRQSVGWAPMLERTLPGFLTTLVNLFGQCRGKNSLWRFGTDTATLTATAAEYRRRSDHGWLQLLRQLCRLSPASRTNQTVPLGSAAFAVTATAPGRWLAIFFSGNNLPGATNRCCSRMSGNGLVVTGSWSQTSLEGLRVPSPA